MQNSRTKNGCAKQNMFGQDAVSVEDNNENQINLEEQLWKQQYLVMEISEAV